MTRNTPKFSTACERLKYIREKLLKLSRAHIHKKYGLSPDTLAAWENGKIKISEKGVDRCIKIYSAENLIVSREWLLAGEGLSPNFSFDLHRYFNTLETSKPTAIVDDNLLLAKEIEYFRSLSPNTITGLISSEDMLPVYACGDHVGGRLRYGKDIGTCIGKNCIVRTKDGSTYIRRVAKRPNSRGYNLVCLNPGWVGNPEPIIFDIEIACAAPIIWHRISDD